MKFETKFKALSPNKSSLFTHEEIDRLAKLSWLAMGIYQYLLLHGTRSVAELGLKSQFTPYAVISTGLRELIDLGLIEEDTTAVEEANNG